jgi:pimeloyl-ACP methyl ester carboxylesterase
MIQSRPAKAAFEEVRIRVHDGVELYGRHYPAPGSKRRPALCLAGLTRNSRDFHDLAVSLSGADEAARPVYTLDIRGRGFSQNAADWRQYAVPVEILDVQDFMASRHLHQAAVIGTSRGGLIAMVLAAAQPSLIGPVVLNDVGPRIERDGLMRLAGFVGQSSAPLTWEAAATRLAEGEGRFFPKLDAADWERLARQRYNEEGGKPALAYDRALKRTFDAIGDGPIPELWPQFMALKRNPCLVIRGELSDLLTSETVAEMLQRHPDCTAHTVADEGHAPLLADALTQGVIRDFLARHDSHDAAATPTPSS